MAKKLKQEDADTPLKGPNPRNDNKHGTKRYEVQRGGSRTLPKPDAKGSK